MVSPKTTGNNLIATYFSATCTKIILMKAFRINTEITVSPKGFKLFAQH